MELLLVVSASARTAFRPVSAVGTARNGKDVQMDEPSAAPVN